MLLTYYFHIFQMRGSNSLVLSDGCKTIESNLDKLLFSLFKWVKLEALYMLSSDVIFGPMWRETLC